VARRAATRADAGPVGCLGRPVALAEHLDTGQHDTPSLKVVGLHRGCGTELEWRGASPPWPGARPHAPTRGPWAASVARSPWRSTSTLDSTTPPASRWLGCTGAVALSSSGGVLHPRGLARGHTRRRGARGPPWSPGRPGGTSTLDSTTPPASRWLGYTGAVALSSSGGVLHPRGQARGHTRRRGARGPPRSPGRPGGAPRHWTAPHPQPRGGWLTQGLWH